ncbi:hypothetical protein B296_00024463 [Ensete ventricosum]|uniref:Uncharacterized protein n=1 Tax=Ensete ventricosum TaxID=4639 RepID=A0A427AQ01_ENSVE|nr:hypothetical protein B296_00024463 [Ensete ventricosum]
MDDTACVVDSVNEGSGEMQVLQENKRSIMKQRSQCNEEKKRPHLSRRLYCLIDEFSRRFSVELLHDGRVKRLHRERNIDLPIIPVLAGAWRSAHHAFIGVLASRINKSIIRVAKYLSSHA